MSNFQQVEACSPEQALARLRLMYAKPGHPYYILAPDYRETSSGIASLHYLCHLLNLQGQEAYIWGEKQVNPNLKTPLLDPATIQRHADAGKVPIAVYPEVVVGNPFESAVVARFLLNFEGFITGKGMDAAPSDLLFYSGALIAARHGRPDGDLLCLPTIDVDLFSPAPPGTVREGRYLYQNRHPLEQIDYSQLPADVRLLSMATPLTLAELADLLRRAQVLYTHEWSMTCVIAVLCGCPVIFIPGHGIDQQFLDASFVGSAGFAMLDQPDALERARAGLDGALPRYVERIAPFWRQLDVFIAKTQEASRREALGNRLGVLEWLRQRYPKPQQLRSINERLNDAAAPSFCVLVRDEGDCEALARTLDSLDRSLYPHVQVHVLGSVEPRTGKARWWPCEPAGLVSTINHLLASVSFDWALVVEAGVEFTASGLLVAAIDLLDANQNCLAAYADEALRREDGTVDLSLRPDFNLSLLLAYPAGLSRHWLYSKRLFQALAPFDEASGQAFELALQLQLIAQQGLGCVGHISEPLLIADVGRTQGCADEPLAIQAHLQQRGYLSGQVLPIAQAPGRYRVDYGHGHSASVSILVYLEGPLLRLQHCLERVIEQTTHAEYEVLLIESGDADAAQLQWLEMLEQIGQGRFRVLRFMPGQPRAAVCNAAAQEARGEYLAWLDAGAGVLDGDWLQALLNHAQRPEVGAVGGKLLNTDGTVAQASLLLGLNGAVARAFEGMGHQESGYMGRLWLDQDCAAVGKECLMVRRELFLEVGGFDANPLLAPWIDTDLCLRLQQRGYLNTWTPSARMAIQRMPEQAPNDEQVDALYARWLGQLARDSSYNVNFSLRGASGFVIEANDLSWRPRQGLAPTLLAFAAGLHGAGRMRLLEPLRALYEAGEVDGTVMLEMLSMVEIERFSPVSIVLQRPLDDDGLLALRRLRAFSQAFKVYELDGYLPEMDLAAAFDPDELLQRLQAGLSQVDRVVVASPALAELLRGQHHDIRVLETALHPGWGRLQGRRGVGAKPRLGWIGHKDAGLITDVVTQLAGEVDWVVLGDCPLALQPFVSEQHPLVEDRLGVDLAALNLDLALVPMVESLGSACSADMRVLQHAACGHPVVCSRVPGFVGGEVLPLSRAANHPQDWLQVIRLHLDDLQASAALGDALQAAVRAHWLLEGERLQAWREAWLP